MNSKPGSDWWVLPLIFLVCGAFPPLAIIVVLIAIFKK